jgi:hypothetical protein
LGQDPEHVWSQAIVSNQVLGIGECHYGGSTRPLITELIPHLRRNGATDLALELDLNNEKGLAKFEKSGKIEDIDRRALPALNRTDNYLQLLKAAHDAGLTIHAVDTGPPGLRDLFMATEIAHIFGHNPSAKVVWLAGEVHTAKGEGSGRAGQFLKDDGFSIFTSNSRTALCDPNFAKNAEGLSAPKAVINDTTPRVAREDGPWGLKLGNWDATIVFPNSGGKSLDLAHTKIVDGEFEWVLKTQLSKEAEARVEDLDLRDTEITDESLKFVELAFPNLKRIDLRQTAISPQGKDSLKKHLPSLSLVEEA